MNLTDLRGLITSDVGAVLRHLARQVPADEAIVELGSFRGMSTAYLATGAKEGNRARVYAVDPWDLTGNVYGKHGYNTPAVREEFERQLRDLKVWSQVTPIQAFSTVAAERWDGPKVGLLFVDADHTERSIRADLAAWTPHLADSHVVVFDDLDTPRNPGVRAVVDSLTGYDIEVQAERLAVCRR